MVGEAPGPQGDGLGGGDFGQHLVFQAGPGKDGHVPGAGAVPLRVQSRASMEALLYGLLLRSGNDAALAIAGHCGGTVETSRWGR